MMPVYEGTDPTWRGELLEERPVSARPRPAPRVPQTFRLALAGLAIATADPALRNIGVHTNTAIPRTVEVTVAEDPLAHPSLEAAWSAAERVLKARGNDPGTVLEQVGERIAAWRSLGVGEDAIPDALPEDEV